MSTPKSPSILVYEHVTGGGMAGEPMPESWAAEGAAMRRALAAEFAAARPAPGVLVALDPRLPDEPGPWRTVRVDSIERLEAVAAEADCTLLIAPETNGTLERLIRRLEGAGRRLLNSTAEAVALAADKAALGRRLADRGVPTPRSIVLNPGEGPPPGWRYPSVVKPLDGAGSIDTFRIDGPDAFGELPACDGPRLLQEFAPGTPMSATFLARPWSRPQLLAIGEQRMRLVGRRFRYDGGVVPSPSGCGETLARAVRCVPGLEGLVGVDFVHDPDRGSTTILEINPRPTTSIVGILGLTPPGRLTDAWLLDDGEAAAWEAEGRALGLQVASARPIAFTPSGSTSRPRGDEESRPRIGADDGEGLLALDVGGANLKAAHSCGEARSAPFPVWKSPDSLGEALAVLASGLPPFDRVAVTTTAELCDCYETKREGVLRIAEAVARAFPGRDVVYWGTDGRFHDPASLASDPLTAAASNWLALATVAAGLVGEAPAVLIDVGTTTTDVIPIVGGLVAARGRTDTERLRHGELVYAGVARTPICALAAELPFQGSSTGLAAELFATTRDVYLLLGDMPDDPDDSSTADGRPATRARASDRLARMACADRESCSADEVLGLAREADRALFDRLLASSRRACGAAIGTPAVAIVSGSGEFLARRVAEAMVGASGSVRSLGELWGPAASDAACARALIELDARGVADHARG